jgi:hypothetical protein
MRAAMAAAPVGDDQFGEARICLVPVPIKGATGSPGCPIATPDAVGSPATSERSRSLIGEPGSVRAAVTSVLRRELSTVPSSCPLVTARPGKPRQTPAQGDGLKSFDPAGRDARSTKRQQRPAKGG